MRCRHVPEWMQAWPGGPLSVYRCIECMRDLPYPTANDAPADEATARTMRVEQRAAEYAMETRIARWGSKWPNDVIRGFFGLVHHFEDEDMYLAGWLAQVIAMYGEP